MASARSIWAPVMAAVLVTGSWLPVVGQAGAFDATLPQVAHAASATPRCAPHGTTGIKTSHGGKIDVLDSLAQIQPTRHQAGSNLATVCQARNGFASFQIEVSATSQLAGVRMKASMLAGPGNAKIPASNVWLAREAYTTLKTMSDGELSRVIPRNSAGICQANCEFPDALIPDVDTLFREKRNAFPFTVPKGQNRAVWVDVQIPRTQRAGMYKGTIVISAGQAKLATVHIRAQVLNTTIPSTSTVDSTFFLSTGGGRVPTEADYAEYAELGLNDRISVIQDNPLTASALRTYVGPLLKGTDKRVLLKGAALTNFPIGESLDPSVVAYYRSILTSLGQAAKASAYCDEVKSEVCADAYSAGGDYDAWSTWKNLPLLAVDGGRSAHWPDPTSGTIPPADLVKSLRSPLELVEFLARTAPYLKAWRHKSSGRQVWAYTSCESGGCGTAYDPSSTYNGWPSYGIDQVASEQVAMGWQLFNYQLDGELYYEVTSKLTSDPSTNPYNYGMNGDGTLFYKYNKGLVGGTHSIPLESIRLKRIRDGRQDYELLKLASGRSASMAARARAIATALFPAINKSAVSDATFDAARQKLLSLFISGSRTTIDAHDLNCDGTPDFLAVQAKTGTLEFYPRTSTDWTPGVPFAVGGGYGGTARSLKYTSLILPGDMTGDGVPDLVGRKANGRLYVRAGSCDGRFGAAKRMKAATHQAPIGIGDFNGDGRPDLLDVRSARRGTLVLLPGKGNGRLGHAVRLGTGWRNRQLVGVGDLNRDGHPDLIARTTSGKLLTYYGNGNAGWKPRSGRAMRLRLPRSRYPTVLGVGDLNGDHRVDLVAIDAAGTMWRFRGRGARAFTKPRVRIGGGWQHGNLILIAR